MPLVIVDPVDMRGSAATSVVASRIISGIAHFQSTAYSNGRAIKLIIGKSIFSASATVEPLKPRILKYIRATPKATAVATLSTFKFKTVKGDTFGQASTELYIHDWDVREVMLGYLPSFYRDIKDFQALISTEANEFTRLYALLDGLSNQFFVDTATYALDDWMKASDSRLSRMDVASVEDKRKAIKGKLNGLGTITPDTLETVVSNFYEADLIELPEPGVLRFRLKGIRGEPINMPDIREAVKDAIPAHLKAEYEYTYLPWSEVEQASLDWDGAEMFTYKELEETFLIDPGFPYQNKRSE